MSDTVVGPYAALGPDGMDGGDHLQLDHSDDIVQAGFAQQSLSPLTTTRPMGNSGDSDVEDDEDDEDGLSLGPHTGLGGLRKMRSNSDGDLGGDLGGDRTGRDDDDIRREIASECKVRSRSMRGVR